MLYAFGFESIAVVACDLYFRDPDPSPGQEGAERGVRVEVRRLARGELPGSIYSAQPIAVDAPIWRGDLLEQVEGAIGSFDRTHHHPAFDGWEPSKRVFVTGLSERPLEWVGAHLADLAGLLDDAGIDPTTVAPGDAAALARAVPEVLDAVRRLLAGIAAGELGRPPADADVDAVRAGWL